MAFLQKFRLLPPTDRTLLVQAVLLLAVTRVALACLPFRFVRRLFSPPVPPSGPPAHASSRAVDRIGWAVHAAGRRMLKTKPCLAQALVAHRFLIRSGHASELKIGVTRDDMGNLAAHAWVECRKNVIIGNLPDLARYRPLGTAPAHSLCEDLHVQN